MVLEAVVEMFACGACGGVFGRWKSKLQNDDADLWLDLAFANHVPNEKPPPIPKVVCIVYDSEEEEVSTICGNTYCGPPQSQHERSSHPSTSHEEKERDDEQFTANYKQRLEMELETTKTLPQVPRSTSSRSNHSRASYSCADVDDASLESIMGPRSCRSTTSSRPPTVSLAQKRQQEQYERFVESFSRSFNVSEEQKESFEDYDDGSSYGSVQKRLSLYLQRKGGLKASVNLHKSSSTPAATTSTSAAWRSHRTRSMSTTTARTRSTLSTTQDKTCRATNVRGRRRLQVRTVEI